MARQERISLAVAFRSQLRVMQALAIRFVISRHGRENLGFLWVLIEPMLLCLGVMIIWRLMKGASDHGVAVVAMVFSGYMPLTLWRHMTNSGIFIYRSAKPLRNHRNITYLDIALSRMILEFTSTTAAAVIIYIVLTQFKLMDTAHDFGYLLIGWLIMASLGFGFGLMLAAASEEHETLAHFIQPIQYLSLPISGSFFLLDWLPTRYRELVEYIPLVHSYETFRKGLFNPDIVTYGAPSYALGWSVIMTAIGINWLLRIQDRIE